VRTSWPRCTPRRAEGRHPGAKANAVVRYLDDEANVDPERLVVVGFSSYRPAPSGASPRIEIAIFPIEPPPPAPAAASAAPSAPRPAQAAPRRRSTPRQKKSDTGLGSL
ncbi:MAG: hypothetical protein L0206_25510, partial [Actinobacteria bacterium]|nr:hypothetical protein [Actinomycetota bacterium]